MRVTVLGAGSLGSLLGGLLAREHDVTLVGREPHVGTVRERGLRLVDARDDRGGRSDLDGIVHPVAVREPPGGADLVLVTTKADDVDGAAADLAAVDPPDAVLPLSNGLGAPDRLASALPAPVSVLAGTCTYGARLREPGVVACTGVGEVALGPRDGGTNEAADRVGAALDAGEVAVVVASDLPRRLWTKLAVNAGINATTALARVENGAIVEGPGREVAADAARETARVARSRGVDLSDERAVERTLAVARTTAGNRSSTLQDVAAGRRTEIEAINGAVVERAGEVRVPVNRTLLALVRTWERGRDRR